MNLIANILNQIQMKREIKLRAWDNDQKEMFQGEIEQYDDMLGFRFEHFGLVPEDDVTYMQFTGLKDKNGVEIYEGDVIRQKTHPCSDLPGHIVEPDPLFDRYEIRWDERRNGWNAFPKSSLSADDFDIAIQQLGGLITWPCEDVLSNPFHYEVIGNIFENQELVNEAS